MENFMNFVSDLSTDQIILDVIAMLAAIFVIAIIIIIIAMFLSWLNFIFMPELEGEGVVIQKKEISGSNEYAGGISLPAERFVYLNVNGKNFSCLASRKNFDLLKSGDQVKILYQKGFFGFMKVTEII